MIIVMTNHRLGNGDWSNVGNNLEKAMKRGLLKNKMGARCEVELQSSLHCTRNYKPARLNERNAKVDDKDDVIN